MALPKPEYAVKTPWGATVKVSKQRAEFFRFAVKQWPADYRGYVVQTVPRVPAPHAQHQSLQL